MRMLSLCVLLVLPLPALAQSNTRDANRAFQVILDGSQIGVSVADVQAGDVARYKLSGQQGAIVTEVSPGTPAEKAGVKTGDVIVDFDGQAVRSVSQLTRLIRETPAGRNVKMAVVRDGKRLELAVTPQASMGNLAPGDLTGQVNDLRQQLRQFRDNRPSPQAPSPRFYVQPGPDQGQGGGRSWVFRLDSEIGVAMRDVLSADVSRYHLPGQEGALVTSVVPSGPAAQAGVKTNDVIVEFNGEHVRDSSHLRQLIRQFQPGQAARMTVVRDGKRLDLSVTPQPRSQVIPGGPNMMAPTIPPRLYDWNQGFPLWEERRQPVPTPPRGRAGQLGIGVQDLTPQLAEYFGTKEGALVASVTGDSRASRAGVKAGDVITSIDGQPVRSASDVSFALAAKRSGEEVKLGLVRDRRPLTLTVR